ncbi:MAG: RsiV family protein [Acetobacterium sp.]|uniref:RsiV family protein n=1 Tax=Acetobacterium sp. TaxID=1872094 RepID=UPI00324269C1
MIIGQTQSQNYYDIDTLRWVYGSRYERPIFYDNSAVKNTLDSFYDNLEASWVQANNANSPYYLTNAGVCVYFNPYEVAPGVVGRVELLIPYSRTDLLENVETLI